MNLLDTVTLFVTLIILAAYLLAARDLIYAGSETRRAARRPLTRWLSAALVLMALMTALRGIAFGWGGAWQFLTGPGLPFVIQIAGLAALLPAGLYWAREVGREPVDLALRRWRRWPLGRLACWLGVMLAWSAALLYFIPFETGPEMFSLWRLDEMPPALLWPTVIALLTLAPIIEEPLFRHFLLYRLAAGLPAEPDGGRTPYLPVALTGALFALAHVGHLEPFWLKWLQVFVPGLVLGGVAWRHGLSAAIALHWLFNLGLIPLAFLLGNGAE